MITKKMLAVSCLFLVLPVSAMRRGARVGVRASKLALTRVACARTRQSFTNSRRLSSVFLRGKKKRRRNKAFVFSGSGVDFLPKRFLCTENKKEKNEKDMIHEYKKLKKKETAFALTKMFSWYPLLISGLVLPSQILPSGGLEVLVDGINATNGCAAVCVASLGATIIAHLREKHYKKKIESTELEFPLIVEKIETERITDEKNGLKETGRFPYEWTSDALCRAMLEKDEEDDIRIKMFNNGILFSIGTCTISGASILYLGYLDVTSRFGLNSLGDFLMYSSIATFLTSSLIIVLQDYANNVQAQESEAHKQEKLDLAWFKSPSLYRAAIEKYEKRKNDSRLKYLKSKYCDKG